MLGTSPTAVATTGRPAAIASTSEIGNCSLSEDKAKMSKWPIQRAGSARKPGISTPVRNALRARLGGDPLALRPLADDDQPRGPVRHRGEGADQRAANSSPRGARRRCRSPSRRPGARSRGSRPARAARRRRDRDAVRDSREPLSGCPHDSERSSPAAPTGRPADGRPSKPSRR